MNKKQFLILRDIQENGLSSLRAISARTRLSIGSISAVIISLRELGFVDTKGITSKGLEALKPFEVQSALIMAAGPSSRLAPISFEKPKGLLEVRGETLIERQIQQLVDAGIPKIVLVLGYKKESFFYLGEKYGLTIIINPSFLEKNNCETIYLAREHIGRSYICCCDQYFTSNQFHRYEYESFYTAVESDGTMDEPHAELGTHERIIHIESGKRKGLTLLGISFWNEEFSRAFCKLLEERHSIGEFDHVFWENALAAYLTELPDIHVSVRENGTIFEFDNLEQLRKFDEKYIDKTSSTIMANIARVLGCKEGDIQDFAPIKEGMTNTSYVFRVGGDRFVYRHPGEGTEKIIRRGDEKKSLVLAKELGMDPTYIYMDAKKGWKVSRFIANTRYPDYRSKEDCALIASYMRKLHAFNAQVDWRFCPYEDSLPMEEVVRNRQGIDMPDFDELKAKTRFLYEQVKNDGLVQKCFCHCDTYRPNWLIDPNRKVALIDWEYAGEADPGVDVGYYIVDALFDYDDAKGFIREYLQGNWTEELERHYMAYVAIIAYYWFVWALFRESCGAVMGEALYNWYFMAKKYARFVMEHYYGKTTV